ncbi:MAG: hypothetical protein IPL99_15230 [Candidatus Competibacteraceae bacterium]|nr:hypothetical protein [Candidatus Competibacteraceae bacterium]
MKNQNGISYLSHDPIERMESIEKSGTVSRLLPAFFLVSVIAILPHAGLAGSPTQYPFPYVPAPSGSYSYTFGLGGGSSIARSYLKPDVRHGQLISLGARFDGDLTLYTSGKIDDGNNTLISEDHVLTIPQLGVSIKYHHTFGAFCNIVCPFPNLPFNYQPFRGHSAGGGQSVSLSQTFSRANAGAYQPTELSPPGASQSLSGTISVSGATVTKNTFTTYNGTANGHDSLRYQFQEWTAEDVLATKMKTYPVGTNKPYFLIDVNKLTGNHVKGNRVPATSNINEKVNFEFSLQNAAHAGAPSPSSGLVRFDNFNWIQRIHSFWTTASGRLAEDRRGLARLVQNSNYVQAAPEGKITDSNGLSALSRPFDMTGGPILDPIPPQVFQTFLHGAINPIFPRNAQPDQYEPYYDQVRTRDEWYWDRHDPIGGLSSYDHGIHFEDTPGNLGVGTQLHFQTTLGGWNEDATIFVPFTDPQYTFRWVWLQTAAGGGAVRTQGSSDDGPPQGEAFFFGTGDWTPETMQAAAETVHAYFLTLPPQPPTSTCVANATTQVSVARGGFRYNRVTGKYEQQLTLTNTSGAPLNGPVYLALDSLSSNASLTNNSGVTSCATPAGSPYLSVNVGQDNVLSANESVIVKLEFTNSTSQAITYGGTRVLNGSGDR